MVLLLLLGALLLEVLCYSRGAVDPPWQHLRVDMPHLLGRVHRRTPHLLRPYPDYLGGTAAAASFRSCHCNIRRRRIVVVAEVVAWDIPDCYYTPGAAVVVCFDTFSTFFA